MKFWNWDRGFSGGVVVVGLFLKRLFRGGLAA